MKTLLLLRHAKSSWKDTSLGDIDRPLKKRGIEDAQLIGRFIPKKKIQPDLVLSSPAERARQTAALILESARLNVELRYDDRIYEASARRLLEVVSQIEDTANTVMMVGHNPGFEELFEALTGEARSFPTASLACIELSIDNWSKARVGVGLLKWLTSPKELRGD